MASAWDELLQQDSALFAKNFFGLKYMKPDWKKFIMDQTSDEAFKAFFKALKAKLKETGPKIYPPPELVFNTMRSCALADIKVVILGQDSYFNSVKVKTADDYAYIPQAMGYAFSVPDRVTPPPSLKTIYKELTEDPDVVFSPKSSGNLTKWVTEEGVFLFNCALTVHDGEPNSHAAEWAYFSDKVIKYISDQTDGVVFILMGQFAKDKEKLIDGGKHCILTAGHPSPQNRTNPFVGSRVFSKANRYLDSIEKTPVNWDNI